MERLPPALEERRRSLAQLLDRPVYVRGVRTPDPAFRGRLRVGPRRVLIECQVSEQGYFWHIPIIEELLDRAAAGEQQVELRDPSSGPEQGPPAR